MLAQKIALDLYMGKKLKSDKVQDKSFVYLSVPETNF